MARRLLGIDIGGANLKAASLSNSSVDCFFPLWKTPDQLVDAMRSLLKQLCDLDPSLDATSSENTLAVTMTGELADCFRDKSDGVRFIVDATISVVEKLGWRDAVFYGVDGCFHDAESAKRQVDTIAAANWHAMGRYVAAKMDSKGWLVDVGSTTCDITGFAGGRVVTKSRTDHDRLYGGELVYVGCQRTPLCALRSEIRLLGQEMPVPLMNEWFATMDDAAIVLGFVNEDPSSFDTADGQARTAVAATRRIARMVGLDGREVDFTIAKHMATQFVDAAKKRISNAAQRLSAPSTHDKNTDVIVLCGHGQWLLPDSLPTDLGCTESVRLVDLRDEIGNAASRCGPAIAVARLFSDDRERALAL